MANKLSVEAAAAAGNGADDSDAQPSEKVDRGIIWTDLRWSDLKSDTAPLQFKWSKAPRNAACQFDSLTYAVLRNGQPSKGAADSGRSGATAMPAAASTSWNNPAPTRDRTKVPFLLNRRPAWHYTMLSCLQTLVTLHCWTALMATYQWYTMLLIPVAIQIAFCLEDYSKSLDGTRGGTPFNTCAVIRGAMWLHRGTERWLGVSCLESRDDVVADCAVSSLAWFLLMFSSYRLGIGLVSHLTNLELFTFVVTCDIVCAIQELWHGMGGPVLISTGLAMWIELLSRLGYVHIPGINFTRG